MYLYLKIEFLIFYNSNMDCLGNGYCLEMNTDGTFSIKDGYNCDCYAIKCPNFIICEKWIPDLKELCWECERDFRTKLTFLENKDCLVCFDENTKCIRFFNCNHYTCINCFFDLDVYNISSKYKCIICKK